MEYHEFSKLSLEEKLNLFREGFAVHACMHAGQRDWKCTECEGENPRKKGSTKHSKRHPPEHVRRRWYRAFQRLRRKKLEEGR